MLRLHIPPLQKGRLTVFPTGVRKSAADGRRKKLKEKTERNKSNDSAVLIRKPSL